MHECTPLIIAHNNKPTMLDSAGNVSGANEEDGGVNRLIQNELLCYVQFHLKRCPKLKIMEVVGSCFSEDVILHARDVLNNNYGDKLGAKLKQRRQVPGKTKGDSTLDDILSAMIELDQNSIETNFGAKDIMSLPKCDPKDVDNFAVLERVLSLEEKIKRFESGLSENVMKTITNSDKIDELNNELKTHNTLLKEKFDPPVPSFTHIAICEKDNNQIQNKNVPKWPNGTGAPGISPTSRKRDTRCQDIDAPNNSQPSDGAASDSPRNGGKSSEITDISDGVSNATAEIPNGDVASGVASGGTSGVASDVASGNSPADGATSVSMSDIVKTGKGKISNSFGVTKRSDGNSNGFAKRSDGTSNGSGGASNSYAWKTVGRDGKVVKGDGQRQNRKRVIQGNVQSDVVLGAPPPKRDFFISRVLPQTGDASFRKFIGDNVVKNFELTLTSNAKAKFKSYKLSVDIADREKVFRPEVWPMGVKLQRWRIRNDSEKDVRLNTAQHGQR